MANCKRMGNDIKQSRTFLRPRQRRLPLLLVIGRWPDHFARAGNVVNVSAGGLRIPNTLMVAQISSSTNAHSSPSNYRTPVGCNPRALEDT